MRFDIFVRIVVSSIFAAVISGCATDRPIAFQCPNMASFRSALDVTPGGAARDDLPDFTTILANSLGTERGGLQNEEANILVLSGGGKWGAYGAGLLKAWSGQTAAGETRPQFDIVTGVSTGALQSTYAFLGQAHDDALIAAYTIERERQLAKRHGSTFFIRHASMADLSPLRDYAGVRIAPLLDEVAAQARLGRKLFVGSIDALDGRMYAIDMTRIASELRGTERHECYVGALLASAAIPVVFRQVTINGTPYFDAGVRNSVFVTGVRDSAGKAVAQEKRRGKLWILVNGEPGVSVKAKVEPKILPTLGRLRELAFDQIQQDSIFAAHVEGGMKTRVATATGHGCTTHSTDEDIFDPAFMKCLSESGKRAYERGMPWKDYPAEPR